MVPRDQIQLLRRASPFFRSLPTERQVIFIRDVRDLNTPPAQTDQLGEFLRTVGGGIVDTAKFMGQGAAALLNPFDVQGKVALARGLVEPQVREFVRGAQQVNIRETGPRNLADVANLVEGLGHLGAAALPGFGPAAASIGEAIGRGEKGRAAGEAVLTGAALAVPELVRGAVALKQRILPSPELQLARNRVLANTVVKLADELAPGSSGTILTRMQAEAAQRLNAAATGTTAAAEEIAGTTGAPPTSLPGAGESARSALKQAVAFRDRVASELYKPLYREAAERNVQAVPTEFRATAAKYLPKLASAAEAGFPPISAADLRALGHAAASPEAESTSQALFGTHYSVLDPKEASLVDKLAPKTETPLTFEELDTLKSAVGRRIGDLEGMREPNRRTLGIFRALYRASNDDIRTALAPHPDLLESYQTAVNVVDSNYETLSRAFIGRILRTDDPLAAEKITKTILRPDEFEAQKILDKGLTIEKDVLVGLDRLRSQGVDLSEAKSLVDAAGKDARAKLSRAAIDDVIRDSRELPSVPGQTAPAINWRKALSKMQDRPGLEAIMGTDSYNRVLEQLKARSLAQLTTQDAPFADFIRSVLKEDSEQSMVNKILADPAYARNVGQLTAGNFPLRNSVARATIDELLNRSTFGAGAVGSPDVLLNPVTLARSINESFSSLAKILPLDSLGAFKAFADAANTVAQTASLRGRLSIYTRGRLVDIGKGGISVHGYARGPAGAGFENAAGYTLRPEEVFRASKNARLSQLLQEGLTTPANSARGAAVAAAVQGILNAAQTQNGGNTQ